MNSSGLIDAFSSLKSNLSAPLNNVSNAVIWANRGSRRIGPQSSSPAKAALLRTGAEPFLVRIPVLALAGAWSVQLADSDMQKDLKKMSYHELLAIAGELGREEIASKLIEIQRNLLNAGVDPLRMEGPSLGSAAA